jgi:hypothetical protein
VLRVLLVTGQHVDDVDRADALEPVDPMRSRDYQRAARDYIRNGPNPAPTAPTPRAMVCGACGRPVEQRPSGWFTHVGLRGDCFRLMDSCDVVADPDAFTVIGELRLTVDVG